MLNIVIFGAPGSGKGTQSELILAKYGLVHISTGDLLRAEIAKGTEMGKFIDSLISKGDFVPDELITKLLQQKIDEHKENCNGFIFDGYPRTVAQAVTLDRILDEIDQRVSFMLDLQVDESELVERLLLRGAKSGRSDDNLETIQKRLAIYHEKTAPVEQFYQHTHRYNAVSNNTTVANCFNQIKKIIDHFKVQKIG